MKNKKHIVIVGGGFAGMSLAKHLRKSEYKVTLIDRNNYHQFAPLFYQVAASQLEPSSILFPLRKEIKPYDRQNFVLAEVNAVDTENNVLKTCRGDITYDYLVLALGADTNYFGMETIKKNAFPMKSVSEALSLRNHLLEMLEQAAACSNLAEKQSKLNIVVVGGGPTGVEIVGALGEMKRYIIPRDYPEIKVDDLRIILVEGSNRILSAMTEKSTQSAIHYLEELGVELMLNKRVVDYNGETVALEGENGTEEIYSKTVIWVSGIGACKMEGLNDPSLLSRGNRLKVNEYNQVQGFENIFALGDMCFQSEAAYPNGHPQVAPVAINQAVNLANNFKRWQKTEPPKPFNYHDGGSMAIVGRNRAVAEISKMRFSGFFAWMIWLFIHMLSIIGFKNKIFVMVTWAFSYFTNDSSLRLIIRSKDRPVPCKPCCD